MSTGDGKQESSAAGDGAGVRLVSEPAKVAAKSQATTAHAPGPLRHEHELHGSSRGAVHGRTPSKYL